MRVTQKSGFVASLALALLCLQAVPAHAEKPTPEELKQIMNDALGEFQGGQVAEATKHLNECIHKDAAFAPCHRSLGIVYVKTGDEKRAASEFKLYLKLNPKAPDAAALRDIIEEYQSRG